jgi:hypothetical protein
LTKFVHWAVNQLKRMKSGTESSRPRRVPAQRGDRDRLHVPTRSRYRSQIEESDEGDEVEGDDDEDEEDEEVDELEHDVDSNEESNSYYEEVEEKVDNPSKRRTRLPVPVPFTSDPSADESEEPLNSETNHPLNVAGAEKPFKLPHFESKCKKFKSLKHMLGFQQAQDTLAIENGAPPLTLSHASCTFVSFYGSQI